MRETGKLSIFDEDIKKRKGVRNRGWAANKKYLTQQVVQNITAPSEGPKLGRYTGQVGLTVVYV